MRSINEILSFSLTASQFASRANDFIPLSTRKRVEAATQELKKIASRYEGTGVLKPPDPYVAYREFMACAPHGISAVRTKFSTTRMARRLAWALHLREGKQIAIIDSKDMDFALQVFDERWCTNMAAGLFDTLLQQWSHPNADRLRVFLAQKVMRDGFNPKSKALRNIRTHARFFLEKEGPSNLSSDLLTRRINLTSACSDVELPEHMKRYDYFARVAEAYVHYACRNARFETIVPDVMEFLRQYGPGNLTKKCLSRIIIKLKSSSNIGLQEKVKDFALELIGDPANDAYWQPWPSADREEIRDLREAQQILNEWLTKQFIELFFNKIAMNPDRKNFWLRYIKYISRFKIYSQEWVYQSMARDLQIRKFLEGRFGHIDGVKEDQSALILFIHDYLFVEFCKTGNALYVYEPGSPKRPDIAKGRLSRKDLCRHKLGDLLMKKSEGRFPHLPYWEDELSAWIQKNLGISA
jgi:hypothetical protein